jgi:pyridoxamine 5'-phosphate oxidase-like protein
VHAGADYEEGKMATIVETKNLADLYDLPPVDWEAITDRLDRGVNQVPEAGEFPDRTWLATINADGSPHVTGMGARWFDGAFWFVTGEGSRKARNLARDPRCTIAVSKREFDLTVEGDAQQVTDPPTVAALAEQWAAGGWPCEVDETGRAITAPYSAPSAGPPPWFVYRITARSATALSIIEPGGATRWRFES